MRYSSIVVLTGAGISAESGLQTFRATDGLWENHKIEDVATPQAFHKNTDLVHEFYNQRRAQMHDPALAPNDAHHALVILEQYCQQKGAEFTLVTQNIDNLHERAGSKNIIHMHGEIFKALCTACHTRHEWTLDMRQDSVCPHCDTKGKMRPDIVWFGEMPYFMDRIEDALMGCDLFLSIGTSGKVYPAAGFAHIAHQSGARTIEFNLEKTGGFFSEGIYGACSQTLMDWIKKLKQIS